jgi:hypothetical protein
VVMQVRDLIGARLEWGLAWARAITPVSFEPPSYIDLHLLFFMIEAGHLP